MAREAWARLARRLALDLALWYCVPAAFLFVYVERYFAPADAVAPHLRFLLMPLLALALFRLIVAAAAGATAARVAGAAAAAALLGAMIAYYALVLIGLQSWGRVVAWDLIASYGRQAVNLADALGISPWAAIGAAALVYLALFALAWLYFARFDWAALAASGMRKPLLALIVAVGGALCAIELYSFRAGPATGESEPLSLTFYPLQAASDLHGHAVDRLSAARLDEAEDRSRAAYLPASQAERKNLIVIVVDALRPDHLGVYGYARDTTPHLAKLASAGRLRIAPPLHASCTSSVCGLLSISASKFLHQFSERPMTLQEALKRHGYRIHMILSGDHTLFYGLKKTYGAVDSYFDARDAGALRYMNDDRLIVDRLASFPAWDGEPVMMQFHLMSAHLLGKRDAASLKYLPAVSYALALGRDEEANERARQAAVNFYDDGVVQADAVIAAILDALERKGYLERAVVAITADHGEALGEHGVFQHGNSVWEETLSVPFMLLAYGYAPTQPIARARGGSQVDIAPTLLRELGLPRPASWKGAPLQDAPARDFLFFQERWDRGLLDSRDAANLWKYWVNTKTGEEYAFNLTLDPKERRNAIDSAPAGLKREWRLRVLSSASVEARRRPGQDPDPR
jgi:glucan phosphoethanolaminetransferase (alkaline phosphatase superfamily)